MSYEDMNRFLCFFRFSARAIEVKVMSAISLKNEIYADITIYWG